MKKLTKLLMTAVVLIAGFTACKDDPEEIVSNPNPSPVIEVGTHEVLLESDGATQTVAYQVTNPVEGVELQVSHTADWLTVNTDKPRLLEFSATVNDSGDAREAWVELSYEGAETVKINVGQKFYLSPLTIEVHSVGAVDVTFTVTTSDPELTWIPMLTYKEYFDQIEDEQELFLDDLEYFKYLAEVNDLSLEDYLSEMLATGTIENIYFDGLDPQTEYTLYTYGLTPDGRRTTEIVSAPFTTTERHDGDLTFTFSAVEENYVLEYTITPSHTGIPYYYGIVDEATLNGWKELYGTDDIREAIQQGEINAAIEEFLDYGFISDPGEYYSIYSEDGIMDWGWEQLAASTKYIIFAAKWNENCELLGEVSTFEHTSKSVEPSDNVITVTIEEITQSSATISTTTTNDDPYVVIPVKSSDIKGLSDEELFTLLVESYDYLLSEYTFEGDWSKTYKGMRPETEYTFLSFGFEASTLTTSTIEKLNFTTIASGAPEDCTFEFYAEPDVEDAWVEITPSDKGLFYHWMVYPASYTEEDAKTYVKALIEEYYEGDIEVFSSWELSQGDVAQTVWDLLPDTEYKLGAVIMDYDTGEFLTPVHFSEPFKTNTFVYADVTIDLEYGPYYDINELIAAGNTDYEEGLLYGDAILPVTIHLEGNYVEYYYDIYTQDLTDPVEWPDSWFYDGLWHGADVESSILVVKYDRDMTFMAIAYDEEYNPSVLFREYAYFTKEGASPAEEFIASTTPTRLARKAPECKPAKVKREQNREALIHSAKFDAKRAEVKARLLEARKAEAKASFEARKARKANLASGRMIAR